MSTEIKNLGVIYVDATQQSSVTYTLPRAGLIVDVTLLDLAGEAANVSIQLNGHEIAGTSLGLPGVQGALVRTLTLDPLEIVAAAGDTLVVAASDSEARYIACIYYLPTVATFNYLIGR